MDWKKAKKHLMDKKNQYEDVQNMPGASASFALSSVIYPLLERFKNGERSKQLYDEIMKLK